LDEPTEFVPTHELLSDLEQVRGVQADYATFSGMGEPSLASNLGEAIEIVKSSLRLPVAVLTNSSLMPREDVRQELAKADLVVAKLDAPTEELFHAINRPVIHYSLTEVLEGIRRFRLTFAGKLAVQMMFIEANKECAEDMSRIAELLSPDEVHLNTPLRPCAVPPLTPEEMRGVKQAFSKHRDVRAVYEAPRPKVAPLDLRETLRRRPGQK
jgi:wyosine [tRNA(Phe)-imidazoG37] synthetase (radical SAM superfamily)